MRRLRARALASAVAITTGRGWVLVAAVYVAMSVLVYARFWHWGPDTRFYLAQTYRLSGLSEHDAGQRSYDFLLRFPWFENYCYFACDPHSPQANFGQLFHGELGSLVATRVVYPLLSVPFVWLLGPQGMLVVPFVAYAAATVVVMSVASRLFGRRWAVAAALAMLVPTTMSAYSIYAYTESAAMAFAAGCVYFLPLGQDFARRRLLWFGVMLTLFAFTRQFHLIILAATGFAWLQSAIAQRAWRNAWLPYVGVSSLVALLAGVTQTVVGSGYSATQSFVRQSHVDSAGLAGVVRLVGRLIGGDVRALGFDPALLLVCLLATIAVLYRWRTPLAALTVGAVLGTFALNVINGEPSHLRYYVTVYPLVVVAATLAASELMRATDLRRVSIPAARPVIEPEGWAGDAIRGDLTARPAQLTTTSREA